VSVIINMKTLTNCFFTYLAFSIPSAVKSSDGSNVPFVVPSDIAYDGLYIMVAKKLGMNLPGLLRL
jgi:hypothetical protein